MTNTFKNTLTQKTIQSIYDARNALQILLENCDNIGIQNGCKHVQRELAALSVTILDAKAGNTLFLEHAAE